MPHSLPAPVCIKRRYISFLSSFLIDRQKQYIINTIELVSDQIVEEIYEGGCA
jgi:hypothetical protein